MQINNILANRILSTPLRQVLKKVTTSTPKHPTSKLSQEAVEALRAKVLISFPPKTENEITAINMNKLALKNIKEGIDTTFPNATPEDFKILKDDVIRKFIYQNPKSGNLYHLINKGKGENGNVVVKALDAKGAFVKEISIKPKTVAIVDDFGALNSEIPMISHGEYISKFLEAYNPALNIKKYDCQTFWGDARELDTDLIEENFKKITEHNNNEKEKIDFVNCSFCTDIKKHFSDTEMGIELIKKLRQRNGIFLDKDFEASDQATKEITNNHKTRMFFTASNSGSMYYNGNILFEGAEGVGALSNAKTGEIAGFSGSRFAYGATHYERGIFDVKRQDNHINITGTSGYDFVVPEELIKMIKDKTYKQNIITEKIENIPPKTLEKYLETKVFKFEDYYTNYLGMEKIPENSQKLYVYRGVIFDKQGCVFNKTIRGTSFSTPIRIAKLALNDSLKEFLP